MKEYLHGFIFITVFIVFGGKVPRAMFLSKAQYNQARCWHRSNNQLGVIQAHPNSPPRTIHTTKEIRTSEIRSRYLLLVRAPHLEEVPFAQLCALQNNKHAPVLSLLFSLTIITICEFTLFFCFKSEWKTSFTLIYT